ncbi:MAG: DUF2905 domain-containing protein [Armatimonadota bacterium]|nr:DUF2905 domain-containing protein [Armatimonadota bacterium]MCX7777552.1 DUF2905 domain-containing protein [Armatimonadota bacterium]MDW8025561.1 DUF2905 domain-containing protein [Armatimonadota bacterium]
MTDIGNIAKAIMILGALILGIGFGLWMLSKLGISIRPLPGDILYRREGFTFYFPLTTCILISIALSLALSLLFWLLSLMRR